MASQHDVRVVEKHHVELEAHSEAVDASAAGQEKAGASALAVQEGEAEQAGGQSFSHGIGDAAQVSAG